jgi:hypothetical protein
VNEAVAIEALRGRGFTESFTVEGERFRVSGTDQAYGPDEVRIAEYYRFEGTSDPDDMSVVYALESRDGVRGILTDAFGSYADPVIGRLLDRVPMGAATTAEPRLAGSERPVIALVAGLTLGILVTAVLVRRRASRRRAGRLGVLRRPLAGGSAVAALRSAIRAGVGGARSLRRAR